MYVLCKYNHYDDVTGTVTSGNTPKPAYIVSDSSIIPTDYSDINSIENIDKFGHIACRDDLGVHYLMKNTFYAPHSPNDWRDNLTDAQKQVYWSSKTDLEKSILIKYQIYTDFYHKQDTNDPNSIGATNNMISFLVTPAGGSITPQNLESHFINLYSDVSEKLSDACQERATIKNIQRVLAYFLSNEDGLEMAESLRKLLQDYRDYALIGLEFSDTTTPAIIDWIESNPSTVYFTTGLSSQGYTMKNGRLESDFIAALRELLTGY